MDFGKNRSYYHTKKYEIMFGILEGEQKYVLNWLIFNIKYYIYNMKILKKTYFEEQISS